MAAPKEQPPRKLSGKRTAITAETLKSRPVFVAARTEGASEPCHALVNLSGPEQRGRPPRVGRTGYDPSDVLERQQ